MKTLNTKGSMENRKFDTGMQLGRMHADPVKEKTEAKRESMKRSEKDGTRN